MSIFSGVFEPLPWLREKTLHALQAAANLVDVANEPDTTNWYKRKLLMQAELIVDRLAPVVAYLNGAGEVAAGRDEWGSILEGGNFALATWCRKWKIGDPSNIAKGSLLHLRTVEEDDEKAEELDPVDFEGSLEAALDLKVQIYSCMSRRLLSEQLSPAAHRMMLWLMSNLWLADPPDVVRISKRFLPTDIGVADKEATEAYKELYDQGFIERVDSEDPNDRSNHLLLRLVIQGQNDSRHPAAYQEEEFGYPGSRIAGQRTSGQGNFIKLPDILTVMLRQWFANPQELSELRDYLQAQIGEDNIYVERAEIKYQAEMPKLLVYFRYPFQSDLEPLEKVLSNCAERWFKERVITAVD